MGPGEPFRCLLAIENAVRGCPGRRWPPEAPEIKAFLGGLSRSCGARPVEPPQCGHSVKRLRTDALACLEHLVDSDTEWWPFAFARPAPEQRFGAARSLLLACLYGLPASLLGATVGRALGDSIDSVQLSLLTLTVCAALFLAFRFIIAAVWNRRAARLQVLLDRRRAWLGPTGADSD